MTNNFIVKKSRILALIIWLGICLMFFYFFTSKNLFDYEVIDDFYLSIFSSGALGHFDFHQVHTNIVFGLLSTFLSMLLPNVTNWTIGLMIFGIFLGYLAFGAYIIRHKGALLGLSLSLILLISTFYSMLNHFNYSKAGAFIMIIGIVLYTALTVEDNSELKKSRILTIALFVLVIFGSLLRRQTTISVVPFLVLCGIYSCYRNYKKTEFKKVIISWFIMIALILLMWVINGVAYYGNSEWRYYKQYDEIRTEVLDYQNLPNWETNKTEYEAIGWTENDYKMMEQWNFADDSFYSIEMYQSLLDIMSSKELKTVSIWDIIYRLKVVMLNNLLIIFVVFVAIILLFILPEYQFLIMGDVAFLFAEIVYLCYKGRYPERAVMIPTMCSFAILLLIITVSNVMSTRNKVLLIIIMFGLSICVSELYTFRSYKGYSYANREDNIALLEELSSEEDKLYVWSVVTANNLFIDTFSPIDAVEKGLLSNSVFAGGWAALTPTFYDKCKRFGDEKNIMRLLAENEQVYYVDVKEYSDSMISQYIREHYNINAECKLVDSKYGYYIYSFSNK